MFNYHHVLHVHTSFPLLLTQIHGIQCCHPLKVLLDASISPCNPKNELVLGDHDALYSAGCAEQDKTVYTPPFGCYLAVFKRNAVHLLAKRRADKGRQGNNEWTLYNESSGRVLLTRVRLTEPKLSTRSEQSLGNNHARGGQYYWHPFSLQLVYTKLYLTSIVR